MSLNLTVTIPLDTAAILRRAHDSRVADADVDSSLFTVANAVIDAVKALPWSITNSNALIKEPVLAPWDLLTPPSSQYSKTSSGHSLGEGLAGFSSSSGTSSRCTSASMPGGISSGSSCDSWWSAREEHTDEFSIDICDLVDGQEHIYYLAVTGAMSLEGLNYKFQQISGVPVEEQRLLLRGYRLNQPDAALSTYGMREGSRLHLLRKAPSVDTLPASPIIEEEEEHEEDLPVAPNPGFEIVVETVGMKRVPMVVQATTTTAELASFIFDRMAISPGLQRLVFRGQVIFDGHAYDMGEAHLIHTMEEIGVAPQTCVFLYFCNTSR